MKIGILNGKMCKTISQKNEMLLVLYSILQPQTTTNETRCFHPEANPYPRHQAFLLPCRGNMAVLV